jgi:hypothetical protein
VSGLCVARTVRGRSGTQDAFCTRQVRTFAGLRAPHCFSLPTAKPFALVLDPPTSLPITAMSHNNPFELTNEDSSLNNQQPNVPTLSTSLLPSVDLPPPQKRGVGPNRTFTKAALGRSRVAPYSRSRGTSATSHAEPTFPAWLAPRSAMRRSPGERGPPRHRNTVGFSGSSHRTTGKKDLDF